MRQISFELWMQKLDRMCERTTGYNTEDLPDQDYYSWWADELTVAEAFNELMLKLREEF